MSRLAKACAKHLADSPRLVAIGHHALAPTALAIVAMRAAAQLTGSYALCYLVSAPLVILLPALAAHMSGLCARGSCGVLLCASPAEAATRQRRWLRHSHRPLSSPVVWGLFVAWAVLTFVVAVPVLSAVPLVAGLVLEVRAIRLHSQLRPWCPDCGPGGLKVTVVAGGGS